MKKALAAAVAAAIVAGAAPAHAAAPDPVRAVRQQFVPGHGVKFSEALVLEDKDKKKTTYIRVTGTYAFGRSGVVASEVTYWENLSEKKPTTLHYRTVGQDLYVRSETLPQGKSWVRMSGSAEEIRTELQPVDVLRLPQLKGLLSHVTSVRDGVHRGAVTREQANKLVRGRTLADYGFRLSTDSTGLPVRFRTEDKPGARGSSVYTESRYSGWGQAVTITHPPEDEVEDFDKVLESLYAETLQERLEVTDDAVAALRR
ncbi:hypothetical protein [Nonomuraea gerenzanensis]|uniref:Lipoprotein n=1 Tax=Nonomuraea gerenzanensis TaxID=93944 RepID=A0A1M4E035_9ACTN|nr:hypothetical protein [Nonomuraea gerenzanensis]UBU14460.1 hypothetical protein LCN96_05400 [Nonomuraea gerenzanensis]SBO92176.1 hypothetical protein BN4615_P1690 [Nonomuraea gerenzanensis]